MSVARERLPCPPSAFAEKIWRRLKALPYNVGPLHRLARDLLAGRASRTRHACRAARDGVPAGAFEEADRGQAGLVRVALARASQPEEGLHTRNALFVRYYGKVVPTAGFQATMGDNEIGRRAKLSSSDEAATRDSAPVVAAAEKSWYYAEPIKANSAYTPAFGDNA